MVDPAVGGAAGRDYYQYPQPFDLPDEVEAPGGRRFSGHRARVYWLLRVTADRGYRHPVGRRLAPAGWVPVFLFREPWSGGQSGGRRVRELREYGVEVQIEEFDPPAGEGSSTTLYRLLVDPIAGTSSGKGQALHAVVPLTPAGTPPPQRTTAPPPLSRYTFTFGLKRPTAASLGTDARDYDLTPGASGPLAPGVGVETEGQYLEQLADLWRSGELVNHLLGRRHVVFWDLPLQRPPFDLRKLLTRALTACGATLVEGD